MRAAGLLDLVVKPAPGVRYGGGWKWRGRGDSCRGGGWLRGDRCRGRGSASAVVRPAGGARRATGDVRGGCRKPGGRGGGGGGGGGGSGRGD